MPPAGRLVAIALGGAVGAAARHSLWMLRPDRAGEFPWTTLGENLAGAFLLGLFIGWMAERASEGGKIQPFLGTGVLGSFTTFSALSYDLFAFVQEGQWGYLAALVLASVVLGVLAAGLGLLLGRRLGGTPEEVRV